ncbi:hypothetical protein GGX14DRAFT_397841 [Mycena pura]|uniref:Uncharacterized protein n=1 Tax=Mycena pura TaxID=153505 RepID=A0AAD6VC01_9AGAR|nr:hypothetical protein GGX14DRAFT_397841 [Mycena pura]
MSAGSKPPRVRLAPVDAKVVESSDEVNAEISDDEEEGSFIDDRVHEDGVVSSDPTQLENALASNESAKNGPSVSRLDTANHSHSRSSKARGLASGSLERPTGKSLEQTTLAVKTSPVSSVNNLTPEEYQMLLAYRESVMPTDQNGPPANLPSDEPTGSPPPRKIIDRSWNAPANSSNSRGVKRPHGHSDDDSTIVPANIEAAFNASVHASPSAKKKKPTTPAVDVSTRVLHTENIKTITNLPSRCGVTDPSIQDPLLKNMYRTLPNISSLWSTINFVQKGQYINLSRVNPVGLQAISQEYGDRKRWTLSINGKTAICISVMMAVKSALQSPSTVVAPSQKSRWSKFITAIPHAQEFERLVGVVCMAFHHKSLHAQIHCDAIAFSTKTFAKDQGSAVRAQFSRGVPSSSTTSARPNTQSTDDALHWDDDIPVYDGRKSVLNFTRSIDDLERVLPRFEDNGSEVPNGSCIAVAYTVTQYEVGAKESVSFNIRFVVVIATPDDEGTVEDNADLQADDNSDIE